MIKANVAVAWSVEDGRTVLISGRSTKQLIAPQGWKPIGACAGTMDAVAVWDASTASILTFSESGKLVSTRRMHGMHVDQAACLGGNWYSSGSTPSGDLPVYKTDRAGTTSEFFRLSKTSSKIRATYLTVSPKGIYLTSSVWPFETTRVSINGDDSATFKPSISFADNQDSIDVSRWMALPLLPLRSQLIQMLADPRSDKRLIIRFHLDGITRSVRAVELPMGFAAALPGTDVIGAVRSIGQPQFVEYVLTEKQPND